jgi:hypothetical protein
MNEYRQIQWKQQHLNNSCAWACLAMLFSRWGVDVDDRVLVGESVLPYLLAHEAQDEHDWITAGVLRQSVDVLNLVSGSYGMRCIEHRCAAWDDYAQVASSLLQRQTPFLTGISMKSIPTPAYDALRRTEAPDRGHAIVLFRYVHGAWHGFDPSADLDRHHEYTFSDIADRVTVVMADDIFRAGLSQKPGLRFGVVFAEPGSRDSDIPMLPYVAQSHAALSVFQNKIAEMIARVTSEKTHRFPIFFEYLHRYIKPLALDFRVTLDAMLTKTHEQQQLCQGLLEFQDHILMIQRELREDETKELGNLQHIEQRAKDIVELTKQHLGQCPFTTQ